MPKAVYMRHKQANKILFGAFLFVPGLVAPGQNVKAVLRLASAFIFFWMSIAINKVYLHIPCLTFPCTPQALSVEFIQTTSFT